MVEITVKRKGTAEYSVQLSTSVFKGKLTSHRMFITIDPEADIKYTANSLRGDDILVAVGLDALYRSRNDNLDDFVQTTTFL